MGIFLSSLNFSLLLLSLSLLLPITLSSTDYTNLIFKGCADQKFQNDPNGSSSTQTLKTLFSTLESQSATVKFYKTTAGDAQSSILGIFQCRGDLSNSDCNDCVRKLPKMSQSLCGDAIAARVQLAGCYLRYEVSGFRQVSGTELLYKFCGSTRASGAGFEERLGTALGEIEKGVESGGGNGFYAGDYESVFVLGQCEGDLGSGDCVDCVKSGVERAKSECVNSISAQIYLQQCYISYAYYPNGVPTKSIPGQPANTKKTVAIVVGGVVGFGFGIACLLFLKSAFKKRESNKYGG